MLPDQDSLRSLPLSAFAKNIIALHGKAGQRWLESLPSLLSDLSKKWELLELKPLAPLSYHYVAGGRQAHNPTPIVLKIGFDIKPLQQEAHTLHHYGGLGCIKLLTIDLKYKALLLEQATPGYSLATLFPDKDSEAIRHAASVMALLHRSPLQSTDKNPTVADWLKGLQPSQKVPEKAIQKARALAEKLLLTANLPVLLHGDLHHHNILANSRSGWLAIDPKGVIGEPAYEIGAFIRNPMPALLSQPNIAQILTQRFDLFSTLLLIDIQRLKGWSYVQAVLAACWMVEDNLDPGPFLAVAKAIESVK